MTWANTRSRGVIITVAAVMPAPAVLRKSRLSMGAILCLKRRSVKLRQPLETV